jgi:AAHS family 4-hydroxybenzoate transporter-like MFS transporter
MATGTTAPAIEVGELIDSRPVGRLQVRIIVLCGLVMLLDGYDVQVMALAVPSVAASWGLPASSFGLTLSAALVGLGIGGAFIAPLGDRVGRRPVMVLTLALAGLATLGTVLSANLTHFVLWRLLTGVGIGASLANATALTSEYMPARKRTWLTCVMYCNIALGGFFAGLIAPWLLNHTDWRGLFLFGGAGAVLVAALVSLAVPESLKFLIARRPGHRSIRRIVGLIAPHADPDEVAVAPEIARRRSVFDLLGRDYLGRTLLLWTLYVFTAFIIYILASWLPTLLGQAGWPRDQALRGSVMFQLGGVAGSVLLSLLVDRGGLRTAFMLGYAICAAALVGMLLTPSAFLIWSSLMILVGVGISGCQCLVVAMAAAFYPMTIRATGVGWAVTVGRLGSVAAPLLGGALMHVLTPVQMLGVLVAPALLCMAASLRLRREWLQA